MKVTKNKLEKLNACTAGITWFENQKDHSLVALVKAAN